MTFKRGPQYRVFVTTENAIGSVVATGTVCVASTSSSALGPNGGAASLGIGSLGAVTSTASVVHELKNLVGIEPTPGSVDAPFEVFGQTRPLDNPIRKKWGLTITRKGEDKLFYKMFSGARFGVVSAALFDGLSTYADTTGYRLYLWDGTDFDLFYHGTIVAEGYKQTLAPSGVTEEQITFEGGLWKPATSGSDLTTSQSIVQA
jgi:hypothetical protein